MLEGLVAWVLNNYLGNYVENLNTDQLSIALLSGQVELENLPLKKDALRHLGLPIEIEAGFIGKIILQIPVRQIRSAPWVIIIDQLYVVASPLSVQEWDSKLEHLTVHEQKLSALDALEAQWRLEMESKDNSAYYYASTYSSWLNYGTGLITDIIENLQLKIHDVHIRYEDCFSITNKTVAFGVTMESLSAQSCDSNWVPEFTHWHSSAASFKLIDMQKLAVYWITLEQGQNYSNIDMADLKALLSQIKNSSFNQHYILEPVSAQAHLKHNRSEKPLRSLSTPRIVCDLQMDEVALSLVDWQYEQIIKCVNGLDDIARLRKFRLYRPECSVKEDAKSWWLYAVCCNFSDKLPSFCKPKPTWNSCLQRAKENVAYVKLYVDILSTPTMALTPDNKKLKDAVEWDRDYNELKVLREIAMRKVPAASLNTNTTNSAGRGILVRWFPTWMGWYSSNSNLGTTVSLDHPPSQLEGEILEALSDSIANNTLLKRDMVFGQFNFTLNSGTLNLCTTGDNGNSSVPMIEFQFKNLSLKVTSCPRTSSHTLELSLGAIYLRDKLTEHSLFPILVGPPDQERVIQLTRTKGSNPKLSARGGGEERSEPLFSLLYEKRSENSGCDYKLSVKSKSLDVVYQPLAIKWLVEFACHPHQTIITQSSIEAMKTRTKKELIKNWEQIIDGRLSSRKSWELNLDISTPQIIFVEKFTDPNSAVAIVDFGKLHLQNTTNVGKNDINDLTKKDSEDDEMFMTPCSTPPGSEEDNSETLTSGVTPQQQQILDDVLNEQSLHQKLYESYAVELTDLQVLISKAKDNWRYAHNKGTSPLHVLDRFNISMQIERCIVHTCDPLYPSLTVNANLPKLVAHVNEQKVAAAKSLVDSVSIAGFPSPFSTPENIDLENTIFSDEDESSSLDMSLEMSRLLIFQFSIDQLALEVQSRGRSIAELQVAGVRASFSRRPVDISINLSVHSLLLVDALQTFGPDFELLVASHKHVGMDSMSGSLRDSEPTSPTSPASPDPGHVSSMSITSPLAITQALSNLTSSPPHSFVPSPLPRLTTALDSEALITVEIVLITGLEPMHIANIQFNNLDIIANQETIVELMGFTHRVFPDINNKKYTGLQVRRPEVTASTDTIDAPDELTPSSNIRRTEITFDFHRLNVLLLRGVVKDGCLIGKKIATASMCEARIQATVDKGVLVEGSLGGLQMVDLTSEGQIHQRIVSVGHDPLSETPHPMYLMSQANQDKVHKAFSFKIKRDVKSSENDIADISIRMASVWYTHSPTFIGEFQSCATEFKQYFANLARSIRAAATDMALGLVQSKTEALAQSLYINSRLSSSLYGSAMSFSDALTPRKRFRRSSSNQDPSEGVTGYFSARDTVDQTPYSPEDDEDIVINIKLDVVLDSPVVILPRSSNSPEVFVAHLGKISVTNRNETPENGKWNIRTEYYNVEVRDMNLYSLDTSSRRTPGPIMSKVDTLYACDSLAKPILYDTILQLNIEREVNIDPQCRHRSLSNLLEEDYQTDCQPYDDVAVLENIQISGTFVTSLKLSLTRTQYEQLLATLQFLTTSFNLNNTEETPRASSRNVSSLADICEEDTGVTTLKMDPHVRAKMFTAAPSLKSKTSKKRLVTLKILFDLPLFTIELRGDSPTGEQGLVDLSFRDFVLNYEKCHPYETNIQVSLRSVTMEDLLQAQESKQRVMVISSDGGLPCKPSCVSRSCPEGFGYFPTQSMSHCSLPDHLEPAKVLGVDMLSKISRHAEKRVNGCPDTPPPSPSAKERPQKNLVLISTLLVDPSAPNFKTHYNSVERSTSVDFNCLDLVVNVESWVIVIDFFSVTPSDYKQAHRKDEESKAFTKNIVEKENEETNISIRSLNVVLVKPQSDLAKVNISHVEVCIKTDGIQKEVKGHLGSMSLLDLTLHGQLYKERFLTSGKQALLFIYTRFSPNKVLNFDAQLKLEMSSVSYVHTKRFVAELQAFFNRFTHLQAVMQSIRTATSRQQNTNEIKKLSVILEAEAPVLYLPVSSKSSDLLIADLGHLIVTNDFKYSDNEGVISVVKNKEAGKKCLLDIMFIELQNVDLFTGVRETSSSKTKTINDTHVILGSSVIRRNGASLLKNKCHLKIQVERNLFSDIYHTVPDMSIQGELSTLDITVDVQQYKLIKGLLFYNLGECTEHILPSVSKSNLEVIKPSENVWTLLSIKFNLMNVVLDLHTNYKSEPIARVNFIKSQLTVESFSNFSQDVDLVSQEIVVIDTRSQNENSNKQNVFTNILQSIVFNCQDDLVQLEVHSRKKQDKTKFTILLNNMRLMTIFDWWESAAKFIFANYEEEQPTSPTHESSSLKNEKGSFELKLNITDSEIVMVQDISQWDTNAVILKSTTVVTYKSYDTEKPLSMNLNNCEAYSCVLGMEEETALSIIDPVTLNMEINTRILEVQLNHLNVHVSYRDMRMFLQILNSLPQQFLDSKSTKENREIAKKDEIYKLVVLGFAIDDCIKAYDVCDHKLDDAALWLTQNAVPLRQIEKFEKSKISPTSITAVEVKARCIVFAVIDDCGDSDVPLLEISFSKLFLRQCLDYSGIIDQGQSNKNGALECTLSADYYNRVLSGWEPILEPWKCHVLWDNVISSSLIQNRLQITVESKEILNLNVTSTFTELYQQVKNNWMQDIYLENNVQESKNIHNYKSRSPFVPFVLKNDTGCPLYFTTLINEMDSSFNLHESLEVTERWVLVAPGESIPFTFRSREKKRHKDSHTLKMHQLCVKVEGWHSVHPVTVDKVGIYFRHAAPEVHSRTLREPPNIRIVFDVALKGLAQKLVTVRSSLLVVNKLKRDIEIRFENTPYYSTEEFWIANKTMTIKKNEMLAAPLTHAHSLITMRPISQKTMYSYCSSHISWKQVITPGECCYELRSSSTSKNHLFRYCIEIKRENYPPDRASALMGVNGHYLQPGHTITVLPILLISNLLPVDLSYNICKESGRIVPGGEASLTNVDPDDAIEITVCLENFPISSKLLVPSNCVTPFNCRIRLADHAGRRLFLQANVIPNSEARINVSFSAPFWIINKTGLPLVFKQGGVTSETAGQFEEHEVARMLTPLLFSFADSDASPTVTARVGNALNSNGTPIWCQNFHLRKGTQVRRLHVSLKDGGADVVYLIGIQVRVGRGKYRSTSIVTISPRYQLHNKSSYRLTFTQKYFVNPADPVSQNTYCKTTPGCHMSFHWPRLDKEQLLCVLIEDVPSCCFSGGLKIDENDSMHVNVRDAQGRIYFLRMEVVLEGATFFVIFADADTMPPPIRVDNFSEVPLTFWQTCCKDLLRCNVRAHTSIPYAWDEPTGSSFLTVSAPGGVSNNYDMNKIGNVPQLTYENFIYIAFAGTFKDGEDVLNDPMDVENQQLVLDVVNSKQVILNRKIPGQRSQLWRMTASGQLQHEGSSPPSHPQQPRSDNVLVLDIEGPAPQPNTYNRLMLRKPDSRRRSTQTWRFTDDGRLCCAHYKMCVQAQDGFFGLRPGNAAILGLPQPICHRTTETGIPLEQAVTRQRLRPGSGVLSVEISTDGPTRVLNIRDMHEKSVYAVPDEREWNKIVKKQRPKFTRYSNQDDDDAKKTEYQCTLKLAGVGISVVTRKPFEELLYAKFETIVGETVITRIARTFCISVRDIQVDNQLLDTTVPVLLYVTPPKTNRNDDEYYKLPALDISTEIQPTPNENAVIFKHLIVNLKKLTINLEEKFILKLLSFIEIGSKEEETIPDSTSEYDYDMQRMLSEVSASYAKRYYFGVIHLVPNQIKLSMKTASKLPPELKAVKRKWDIPFIKFEDALVDLKPFVRRHPFETAQFLLNSIKKHFKDELIWQAAIILGSVDVLGNPVGFMNDVSEGVSGFFTEGSVRTLVKNVTHGLSNSAAKVTESISDGLGRVTMDDEHEEMRQRIRQVEPGKSGDHLLAGIKGLSFGILGGATSIFKHVYEGAANEGIQGVFSGLGKGLVGTVTKPVVGVLDLASETARAVRETSRSRISPDRSRLPRCVWGTGGLLPPYSKKQSKAQQLLYTVSDRNFSEHLVAFERLNSEDLKILVSNQKIWIVGLNTVQLEVYLSDLQQCQPVTVSEGSDSRYYIEITMKVSNANSTALYQDAIKRPIIRCDSYDLARWVSQQVNYAKRLYDERLHTLTSDVLQVEE